LAEATKLACYATTSLLKKSFFQPSHHQNTFSSFNPFFQERATGRSNEPRGKIISTNFLSFWSFSLTLCQWKDSNPQS